LSWSSPSVNIAKNGTDVTYTLTLTESYQNDTTIDTGDFTVTGSGTVKSVTKNDNTYTVVVTAGATDGAVTLTPKVGIVSDLAGNVNTATPTSASFMIDNTVPTTTITADPTTTPTSGTSITYTIAFSEAVTDFDATDITVSGGDKETFAKVSDSQYTLVVTTLDNENYT
jgi:hypothetical protein